MVMMYGYSFIKNTKISSQMLKKLQECFENAKKYDNYEDFINDKILYKTCVMYKIVNKIIETFPKINIEETIINESKKYKTFKEFSQTIWYRRTKSITGLIQKVKKANNWKFFINKKELNYVKDYPEVVEMINSGITSTKISKIMRISNSKIYKIKKEMHEKSLLKVHFNIRKNDK
jgi:predicted transcriptional regulator